MSTIDKIIKEKKLKPEPEKPKFKEIIKKDKLGNIIYMRYSTGYEIWDKYDERNNLIYTKDSHGNEFWKEYDKNNNVIYYKINNGYEEWKEYDKNNNLIHYKNNDGYEYWSEYGEHGIEIRRLEYADGEYYLNSHKLIKG